jgi:ABC-2 type transport system ATP-binding protein
MPAHAIEVENLEKYFPPAIAGWRALLQPVARLTERALAGVSFAVRPGEIVAVVGENGAGKSTLLRVLATLLLPTRGRAAVGGFDVAREPERVRRALGYHTGGDEGFYGRLSAEENLRFFAAMNGLLGAEAARAIARAVELLGLRPGFDHQVRTLSTGMVHRLGLARALLHEPAVLLLDEPTRSLDPLAAAEFRRFLKENLVRQHGTTLLFTSHTLSEVEELADRVTLLDGGRLVACDSPRGLRASAGVASLLEALEKLAHAGHGSTSAAASPGARA